MTNQHVLAAARSDPDLARLFSGFCFTSSSNVPKAVEHILDKEQQEERKEEKERRAAEKKITLALTERVHGHRAVRPEACGIKTRHEGRQEGRPAAHTTNKTITKESTNVHHDRRREPGPQTCD